MPHDIILQGSTHPAEPAVVREVGCTREPAFRRLCSYSGWPLLVQIVWWALRNDRERRQSSPELAKGAVACLFSRRPPTS